MNRAYIKAAAREQIKGNLWIIFGIIVMISVIAELASLITQGINRILLEGGMSDATVFIASVLAFVINIFVAAPFEISLAKVFLNLSEGIRPKISDTFWEFNYATKSVTAMLRMFVYICLWMLLFIIPGIIMSYSYIMTPYIIAENPNASAKAAMKKSVRMMKGHKWELFVLQLSFIGWGVLTVLTFGILAIYVVPYMEASVANFYQSLKGIENEPTIICSADEYTE